MGFVFAQSDDKRKKLLTKRCHGRLLHPLRATLNPGGFATGSNSSIIFLIMLNRHSHDADRQCITAC